MERRGEGELWEKLQTGYLLWWNMFCCGQGGLAVPQNPSPVSEMFPEAAGYRSQLMECRSQETACCNKLIFLCSGDPWARVHVICISSGTCTVVVSRKDVVGGVCQALSYSGPHQCWSPDHVQSIPAASLSCLWMPGIIISLGGFFKQCTSFSPSSAGKWWQCPTPFLSPVASWDPRAVLHHDEVLELQSVAKVPFYHDGCHTVCG